MYGFTLLPFPPPLLLDQEAAEARAALVKVEAQAAIDEKVRNACWRALDKAKPSTSYTVLEKREQIMNAQVDKGNAREPV